MKIAVLVLLVSMALCAGCVSVPVSPTSLAGCATRDQSAREALDALTSGVWLANAFLDSEFRHTLPAGRIDITEECLIYRSGSLEIPIHIRCTTFGDVLVAWDMAAQERSWGFIVGKVAGHGNRAYHNSLFYFPNGVFAGNVTVAGIILHELTHIYLGQGLDSMENSLRYYGEAVFLFRYRSHSMERAAYRTTDEYWSYITEMRRLHPQDFSSGTPKSLTTH